MLARTTFALGAWVGRGGACLLPQGARRLASASRGGGARTPSAGVMGELLRGVGAKHSGAKHVLAARLVAILSPGAGAAPPGPVLRAFAGTKAGKEPEAEAEAMRAAREALEGLLVERGVCTREGLPDLVAALGGADGGVPRGERLAPQEPAEPRAAAHAHASEVGGDEPSRGVAVARTRRDGGDDLPAELIMTSSEDSSVAKLREEWRSASKMQRKALVHRVLESRMKSLYRRCLESARRCPDPGWADTMLHYVRGRFRERQMPGALAVLIAQGEHELANMELMHAARDQKMEEQRRKQQDDTEKLSFLGGAAEDGAGL